MPILQLANFIVHFYRLLPNDFEMEIASKKK